MVVIYQDLNLPNDIDPPMNILKFLAYACLVLLILPALSIKSSAQTLPPNVLDSLQNLVSATTDDSIRGRALNKLGFHFIFNENDKALPLLDRGLAEADRFGLLFGKAELLNTKAIYFDIMGEKDSAELYFAKSLELSEANGFHSVRVLTLNGMGLFFWKSGRFDEALSYFYQALEMNAQFFPQQEESKANYLSNIGLIFQELRQYDKAIDHHNQSLEIRQRLGLVNGEAVSYANLGVCHLKLEKYEDAEQFYLMAIDKSETAANWRMYYSLHDNLANLYSLTDRPQLAIEAYKKALERPESVGENPKSDLSAYINIAAYYNNQKQPRISLQYSAKGDSILQKFPQLYNFSEGLHYARGISHFLLGNHDQGMLHMKEYSQVLDSVFSDRNAQAVAEIEKMFKTIEKDNTILKQEQTIQQKELDLQKRTLWAVSLISLVLIVSGFLFSLFKRKEAIARQAHLELRLAEQKEVARIQEERLRISRELHDNIGSYLTLLSASVEQLKERQVNGSAEKLQDLQDNLSMSMRELRKTVWLLNKQVVTVDELGIRLRDFFKPLHQNGTRIVVSTGENSGQTLTEIQTTHLFRILQEAINNAYKYSGCSLIDVKLRIEEGRTLCFVVKDDGQGFDQETIGSGNGFRNMHSRMEELQGELKISSIPNKGTVVEGCFEVQNTNICV